MERHDGKHEGRVVHIDQNGDQIFETLRPTPEQIRAAQDADQAAIEKIKAAQANPAVFKDKQEL